MVSAHSLDINRAHLAFETIVCIYGIHGIFLTNLTVRLEKRDLPGFSFDVYPFFAPHGLTIVNTPLLVSQQAA